MKKEVDLGSYWAQNKDSNITFEGGDRAQSCVKREVDLGSHWAQNKDSDITSESEDRVQSCVKREEELGCHCQPLTPLSLLKPILRFLRTQHHQIKEGEAWDG